MNKENTFKSKTELILALEQLEQPELLERLQTLVDEGLLQ